jgi:ubiquinone/menaquinone biosynthesis C-methylase UbiE
MIAADASCDDREVSTTTLEGLATAVLHVPGTPERVLEIGCGEGDGVLFLAREFPSARVRGTDRSREAIDRAVARVGLDPEGRVAFKRGARRSLRYPDDFFDLVAQRHGALLLGEAVRVLKPGGHLLYVEHPQPRLLRPRPRRLRRGLERSGFETVRTGEGDGWSFYVGRLTDDP